MSAQFEFQRNSKRLNTTFSYNLIQFLLVLEELASEETPKPSSFKICCSRGRKDGPLLSWICLPKIPKWSHSPLNPLLSLRKNQLLTSKTRAFLKLTFQDGQKENCDVLHVHFQKYMDKRQQQEGRNQNKTARILVLFVLAYLGQWLSYVIYTVWSYFGEPHWIFVEVIKVVFFSIPITLLIAWVIACDRYSHY